MASAKTRGVAWRVWVCVVAVVVARPWVTPAGALDTDLRLMDNGYEGLVVAISDQISQDHCNHVIHGLKSVLRELSATMWVATEGRASIREATVSLPRSWRTDSLTCSLLTPLTDSSAPSSGHIRVAEQHPVFGSRPWTQQSEGCGRQGDFIQLGADLLRTATNDSYAQAARLLLAEWAKFRWGVFDERGHANDPLYPPTFRDPHTRQWVATTCADGAVRGAACDPTQPGCSFAPEIYNNDHLTTSLLSLPEIPSVRLFCNDKNHNREAPTKHNALCGGRSVWEIIRQTDDFRGGRNPPGATSRGLEPVLRFVKESNPRYMLVIEDTSTMNLQRRWEYLRKAMRRVVVYDVPDGAHIGVVTFNAEAQTVAPLTYIESEVSDMRQRVGSSLPRNPSHEPESTKCVLCGLQEALRVLEHDGESATGATIILITTGMGSTDARQVDEMVRLVETRRVRVELVLYPLSERRGNAATHHGLQRVVEASRGTIYTVMDEGVGNDSKVKMMIALMDALLAAVRKNAPAEAPGSPVLVHSEAYPGGVNTMSAGTFALDDSLGPNARFSVYYYDLNHVGNAIRLTAPSGQMIASVNVQEEDGDVNMIFINLEKAERGLWTYSVENRADSHQGLYVQVTAKRNSSTGLQVRLWTSSGSRPINASDPSSPVVVYAEVKDGVAPILDARVVAKLQRLGTNATGSSYQPIFIDLWDNGIGDPDITKGDGIYSRYLPTLQGEPGRYLLSAEIDYNSGMAVVSKGPPTRHHKGPQSSHLAYYNYRSPGYDVWNSEHTCCGHAMPHVHTRRAAPFLRHVTWGVLEVVSPPPPIDNVPPSRILDLRVDVNDTVHEISLRWTAPGDDWDIGRAHHYEAVVAPDWRVARSFQGDRLTGLPQPLSAGTLHATTLHFTRYEELWFVSVRAVDEAGNVGAVGNLAALWVPRPPTTYEITTRTQPALTTSGNYTLTSELGSGRPVGMMELELEDVAVILGSLGGILLVVGLTVSYCYCHTARKRKQEQEKDAEKNVPSDGCSGSVMVKSGSLGMDEGGSHESLDSVVKDTPDNLRDGRPLSPVQSWGASTLLQEHERRLSVHSGAPDEGLTHNPFPDVTVTDHNTAPVISDAQVYLACQHEDPACRCPVPGPDYTSYAAAWDEPLTGHLLSRARTGGPMPHPPPQQITQVDRKRRNVTQV